MDKKYAIFDMDGTIVESMGYWQNLGREYLANLGITEGVKEILEEIKPMTVIESSTLFIQRFGLEGPAEAIAQEMRDIMKGHYLNDICLKPGIEEYLNKLSNEGVKMCVASATPEALVDICLTRLGVKHHFDFLLSCETVGAGKKRPDVFLEAAKRLGSTPEETAVFEDAIYAVRTSKAAGFYTVAIYDECGKINWENVTELADELVIDWREAV